ncbi:hypothetical protein E3U55_10050 [Filobacillus milosensis]|uniref:VOC domain-containing protein n=1 Tax=Filobacillus milosensis TaxID=94137 RepID=A0A4Y8IFQ6_9BACI|nr:VOC family protein [Filobacillus milosensis]TFB19499.1 hypothetical protein E3U55_10050 [Filobacillus milosensis]
MNRVVAFEMSSQEPEKAAKFYSAVFDWKIGEPNYGYHHANTGNQEESGIDGGIAKGPHDHPLGTRVQIEVESIDQTVEKAKANGAMVVREKMDFGDFCLAYLVDPTGLGFSLIENKK